MRQLTCTAPGVVEWRDVPAPRLGDEHSVLVRPIAVARCEIDPFLIMIGPREIADGFALGHEAVAEVLEVGDAVTGLAAGQLVLPSFQLSCGTCRRCTGGHSALCDAYPTLSDYGMAPMSGTEYGGMLSDVVLVPHAATMLQPLPEGVDPVAMASVPDNVVDGYRGVAPHLAEEPGADVLIVIHGTPSIGLYAAQAAIALGAASVTVASDDERVLALAADLGAIPEPSAFTGRGERHPIVVDCGTRAEGLRYSLSRTQPEGVCQSVSYYLEDVALPLGRMYTLGIRFQVGRAHSASLLPEVTALIAEGRLHPEQVTTEVVDWDDATEAYLDDTIKLVVRREPTLA